MKDEIRILHAITRLDKGGSAVNTLLSAMALAERGYRVDLVSGRTGEADNRLLQRAEDSGVRFIVDKDLVRNIHPVRDTLSFVRMFRLMRRNRYDIVHAHSSKAGLICRAAAKCAGVKRVIYTPHGHVFYGYFGKALTRLIIFAEALLAFVTDRIIGLTTAECDEWLRFGIGKEDRYAAMPSGIEFDELKREADEGIDWKRELGIPPEGRLVGSVGRFIGIKGFGYFIEAAEEQAKKRDDVYFMLVGDGPLRGEYSGMVASAGMEGRFHIVPWQENIGAAINSLDIFILSSLNEGMGRALIEAMFFAKPVIATCVGGVPAVVSADVGILVEPGSSRAISEAMDRLLDDPQGSREMGGRGRGKAIAEYSAARMIDDLDRLYRELLGRA